MEKQSTSLTLDTIEKAFNKLGWIAINNRRIIDISVYGGAAMVMCFDARPATRDVDSAIHNDKEFLKKASKKLAEELNLDENWLNDGVKGFLSHKNNDEVNLFKEYPDSNNPGLRVYVPSPEYLLAMKCMAMRLEENSKDIDDIKYLVNELNFKTPDEVLHIVSAFYPNKQILPKTEFGIIEIMETVNHPEKTIGSRHDNEFKP
jgi:hypothetical protein